MNSNGTTSGRSKGGDSIIEGLRGSLWRLRILTVSLFALTVVLNLTPAGAEVKAKITGEDVVDRSLTGDDVAGGSIDGFNVALDTLVGGHVQDSTLQGVDVQDGSLTGADVQAFSLTGLDVAPSSISGGHLLDNNVTGNDIDESTLANLDAHDFFNDRCDPHSEAFIECGTLSFTLGHAMPVIAFWNYGYSSEIDGDKAMGVCETRVDGDTTADVGNGTYEELDFFFDLGYGATPIVDVMQLSAGTHTVSLWCSERLPDDRDFVVNELRIAVIELGLD